MAPLSDTTNAAEVAADAAAPAAKAPTAAEKLSAAARGRVAEKPYRAFGGGPSRSTSRPATSQAERDAARAARSKSRPPLQTARSATAPAREPAVAATRLQAAARGRTGRRRSMEVAKQRFGYLKSTSAPGVPAQRGKSSVASQAERDAARASRSRSTRPSSTSRPPMGPGKSKSPPPPRSSSVVSRSAIMPCARANLAKKAAAAAAATDAPPTAEVESDAAIRAAAQMSAVLESVGKEPVVPGLLESTFAGSTDEDIAEACERMRVPKGTRWDVTAKLKARDERLAVLRSMLSRVAEQRKAFGTLVAQIEVKLLGTAAEERDKAEKADRALIVGSGLGDRLERIESERDKAKESAKLLEVQLAAAETARDAAERAAAEHKAEAAEAKQSRDAATGELVALKETSMRDAGLVEGTLLAGQDRTAAQAARVAAVEQERDALRAQLAAARADMSVDAASLSARSEASERLLADATAERDAARLEAAAARKALAEQTTLIARAEGKAEMASAHATEARAALLVAEKEKAEAVARARAADDAEQRRFSELEVSRLDEQDKIGAAVAACDAKVTAARVEASAAESKVAELELRAAASARAVEALTAQLEGSEAERRALLEATARADGGAAETKAALAAAETAARDLRAELDTLRATTTVQNEELRQRAARAEEARERLAAELQSQGLAITEHKVRWEGAEKALAVAEERARAAIADKVEIAAERDAKAREADLAEQARAVEASLRATAETKEERERRERTAALAQLLALQRQAEADRAGAEAAADAEGADRAANDAALAARAAAAQRELGELSDVAAARAAEIESLQADLDEKNKIDAKEQALALSAARGEVEALRRRLAATEQATQQSASDCEARVGEMEAKLREADVLRRRLHNTIQELRGNIRVFARVRPFLPSDGAAATAPPVVVDMADGASLALEAEDADDEGPQGAAGSKARKRGKELFSYDHVFGPATGQEEVFAEVAEFVQSALDGYQVCLFSYGQTGSGKTHTMQGSGNGAMRGIIPRAMEQVAAYCDTQRARGWVYEMEVSYVEIYNEQVRDLLADGPAPAAEGGDVKPQKPASLEVRRDPKTGRVYVDGCTRTPVDPADEAAVDGLMSVAASHRCVAATDMNAVSSRSHAVFTLHLTGTHAEKKARLKGALNLVDLAGSERLDRSGAVGQRAKEAMAINKSLSALAGVFSSLNAKRSHVPYRDSKLTFLLQPALSGDGKTLLFVNLSPTAASANESLCSLRFAKQVQQVELGKAKRTLETIN